MKLLLDTHAFLWWDSDKSHLSQNSLNALFDSQNDLFLSVVSVWEMQIKAQTRKLTLRLPLLDLIEDHRNRGLLIIGVALEDVYALAALPMLHRDPFDRLLIAQATRGGYQLVSRDPLFAGYGVTPLW